MSYDLVVGLGGGVVVLMSLGMASFLGGMTKDSPMPNNNDMTTLGKTVTSTLTTVMTNLAVNGGNCRSAKRVVGRVRALTLARGAKFIISVSQSSRTCGGMFSYFGLPGDASRRGGVHDTTVRRTAGFTTLIPVRMTHGTCRLVNVVTSMTGVKGHGTIASTYMTVVSTHSTILTTLVGIHVGLNSLGSEAFMRRLRSRTSRLRHGTYVGRGRLLSTVGRSLEV